MRLTLAFILALAPFTIHAQERTAGSALDTQMTWTSLAAQAKAASDKADAVNTRVDQVVICAKKGMLYMPGVGGIDSQGCKEPFRSGDVNGNLTQLYNAINTLNSNVNNSLSNIYACNKAGQVYDGTKCIASSSGERWIVNTTFGSKTYNTNSMNASSAVNWYKKTIGLPWNIPACTSQSGFGSGRKCSTPDQLCYTEAYTTSPRQGNCSSCNGPSGYDVTASFTQFKCD